MQQIVLKLPHVMIAYLFRWPDLLSEVQLEILCENEDLYNKALDKHNGFLLQQQPHRPCSYNKTNKTFNTVDTDWICCNPYHWSRILPDPFPMNKQVYSGNLFYLVI